MEKFKAGDKVIRTAGWDDDFVKYLGRYTVASCGDGYLALEGCTKTYYPENFKLVVNVSDTMEKAEPKFKNMKFRVKDNEHSKLIQTELFKLGYTWGNKIKEPKHTQHPYIYTDDSGNLGWGNNPCYFENESNTEYELQSVYTFVEVEPDLVEYDGVKYLKKEFEKAISGLKAYKK